MRLHLRQPVRSRIAIAVAAALACASPAQAVDTSWTAGTADWATGSNWDTGNAPTAADNVFVNNGGTAQVQAAGAAASSIRVAAGAGASGSLEITAAGTLTIQNTSVVGQLAGATGSLTVDGTLTIAAINTSLAVGADGGTGTLTVRNGGTIGTGIGLDSLRTGLAGTGTTTIDGAGSSVRTAAAFLGESGGNGTLNLSAGGMLVVFGGAALSVGTGTINIGTGAAAGVLDAPGVRTISGTGTLNFNHTDADYFFTRDGLTGGGAIAITGITAVNHTGTGTTTLTGANTYTGGTTVTAGTLRQGAAGAFVNNGTYVVNGGTLSLNGFNLSASSLSGTGGTVSLGTATFTVNQAGSTSYAGVISGTGALTKSGTGTLTLTGANTYAGGTTVNAGTLAGTTTSLQGAIVNNATVSFDQAANGTYAGAMSGTGTLAKTGAGTLTLTGANTYAGGTTVNAGTLVGTTTSLQGNIVNNAAVSFDQAANGTYAGAMSGTGTLAKAGAGTLNLTGASTYSGATTVNAGTLAVNGSIASPVTVNSGGTLGGSGAINNAVTLAAGSVFAPGNSIGTITVNGSVTFAAGSTYRVEVDAAGNADRINVTGTPGRATINGGTVDVQASAGSYQRNTTYTILNATGGVTGAFSAVTSNLAFLTPSLAYDANNVFLTLLRNTTQLGAVAATPNQLAVAGYLDGLGATNAVVQQFDGLSADQARAGFASVGGDGLSALSTVTSAEARRFMSLLGARAGSGGSSVAAGPLRLAGTTVASDAPALYAQAGASAGAARPGNERGFWMRASGARGDMDGNGNATGFDWRGGSFALGADAEVARGTVLGGAFSYGRSEVSLDGNAGTGRVKSPRFALYGSHAAGPWQFKGALGYASHEFDTRRNVALGAATSVASGSHRGTEWSGNVEAQYTIAAGAGQVKPFAGLSYVRLKESGFTETGSPASLAVAARSTESVVSNLGVRYARPFNAGSGAFEARASWAHEFGDASPAVSGRLASIAGGATFTVAGVPVKRDALVLGAGVSNEVRRNLSVHADVHTELRGSGQSQHALAFGLRYAW